MIKKEPEDNFIYEVLALGLHNILRYLRYVTLHYVRVH